MNSGTLRSLADAAALKQDNDSLKFQLFARTMEMKQIAASLEHVALMSEADREKWAADHEENINQLLDVFMDDASSALEGLHLDPEAMKLSMEFMSTLKDTMNRLQSILNNNEDLLA
jgi:hypothetical protein